MKENTRIYFAEVIAIRENILKSDHFKSPDSETFADIIKLETLTSNYFEMAIVLQSSGIVNTSFDFAHVLMNWTIHCEVHRQNSLSLKSLDRGRIFEKFESDLAETERDRVDEKQQTIRVDGARFPALSSIEFFRMCFVLPNSWDGELSEFAESINEPCWDGYAVQFQNLTRRPNFDLPKMKPYIELCFQRRGWTVRSDTKLDCA